MKQYPYQYGYDAVHIMQMICPSLTPAGLVITAKKAVTNTQFLGVKNGGIRARNSGTFIPLLIRIHSGRLLLYGTMLQEPIQIHLNCSQVYRKLRLRCKEHTVNRNI